MRDERFFGATATYASRMTRSISSQLSRDRGARRSIPDSRRTAAQVRLRVRLHEALAHAWRARAPERETSITVVVVHIGDERFLVPHEERWRAVARAFRRLRSSEADPAHPREHRALADPLRHDPSLTPRATDEPFGQTGEDGKSAHALRDHRQRCRRDLLRRAAP